MTVVHRVTAIYRAVLYRFDCSKDHPDEVAESLSAYGGGRPVTGKQEEI